MGAPSQPERPRRVARVRPPAWIAAACSAMALALAAVPGCVLVEREPAGEGCSLLFAYIGVRVVDGDGRPVNGLSTQTVYLPTGAVLHESTGAHDSGLYVVLDDSMDKAHLLPGERHDVRFYAHGDEGTAMGDFQIRAGQRVCHVEKLAGPDTLVLEPR